jgi:hypothetical protein
LGRKEAKFPKNREIFGVENWRKNVDKVDKMVEI